ncbi:AcuC Deacetylases, including yeast histone deacetylase and acetoin utilization protein [Candidatus Nanopelagicaceae bacterium]
MEEIILIHSDEYANWVFDPNHPTQGRRFMNAKKLLAESFRGKSTELKIVEPRLATKDELLRIHSSRYVSEVLDDHKSGQWTGERPDLSNLAGLFAGGTLVALDALLTGKTSTAVHFPGAKHHAQHDYSSGFCIFADFALAADIATKDHGKKVAILDIDAHHGDGTENLTADNPNVLTFSIHEKGIFPGTGNESDPSKLVYNYPLGGNNPAQNPNKDDQAFIDGVTEFCRLADQFQPDLLFIACGADGHVEDPLSSLQFTLEGYGSTATLIRSRFPSLPILVGGAGGYLPDSRTPEVWEVFCQEIA